MSGLCSIALILGALSFCTEGSPQAISGYVEGNYIEAAPVEQATVKEIYVTEGQRVSIGQILADLEREDAQLALEEARASANVATATLEDMKKGLRPEELKALESTVKSWEPEVRRLEDETARSAQLLAKSVIAQLDHDRNETALAIARARLSEARARLSAAQLPSRSDALQAQSERSMAAVAALKLAEWRYSKRTIKSEVNGRIERILRRKGELSGPSIPVMTILPDDQIKLRFYVSGDELASFGLGEVVEVRCNGCPKNVTAKITHVANSASFTPPVIYSLDRSQRLSYLIEATPLNGDLFLLPGQIVAVSHGAPLVP